MNPLFRIDFSISDSLKIVRKSVLIYETIIYTAVSSTNLRTQTAEYYALEEDDGLTMNLGINPLLQFGLEETRAELCRNILTALAVVNYVPFDSDTIGNPALESWGMC